MYKLLCVLSLSILKYCSGITCYTPANVTQLGLVSYQNKVYNIDNYVHPGGQVTLLLSKGQPLEDFFNKYKFHTNNQLVNRDLQNLYVGDLYYCCNCGCVTDPYPNTVSNPDQIFLYYHNLTQLFIIISTAYVFVNVFFALLTRNKHISFLNENFYFCEYVSRGTLLFMAFYTLWWGVLLFLSLYSDSNSIILNRLGVWISLNIAFTLLPITRNSIWVIFLKLSYNKLIQIHKFVAVLCLISVIIKMILPVVYYDLNFLVHNQRAISATISSASIILTFILSTGYIRHNLFELFFYSHKILFVLTIVTMALHFISALYYVIPSISLYLIDIFLRHFYSQKSVFISKTNIGSREYKSYCSFITITLLKKIDKIEPGSFFFICCKNISQYEWHPISVLTYDDDKLLFCIKDMGNKSWSTKITDSVDNSLDLYVQGPYLHLDLCYRENKYKHILLIANGIGITPFISILRDIKNKKLSKLKKVVLIWIIPHSSYIENFSELLNFQGLISIKIYITRPDFIEGGYPKYLSIVNKKIDVKEYIPNYIILNGITNKELCVISCGSRTLLIDVHEICKKLKIDLYNENF